MRTLATCVVFGRIIIQGSCKLNTLQETLQVMRMMFIRGSRIINRIYICAVLYRPYRCFVISASSPVSRC